MEALPPDLHPYIREGLVTAVVPSSIILSDTIRILFEITLLARILSEVSGRGLLRDEQCGFMPKHSTSLLLAYVVHIVTRNFGEKKLTVPTKEYSRSTKKSHVLPNPQSLVYQIR
jgi:hypothetical protein